MAETPTPPGALPTIRSGLRIAFSLETLIALIGGVVFCTAAYLKLDTLDQRVARIEKAMGLSDKPVPLDSTSALPSSGGHP